MLIKSTFNQYTFSGIMATFIGIGIGRFAYIAFMPALINSGWFSSQEVSYLGAATLIGYIFGAPLSNWLSVKISTTLLIRYSMLISCISYFACAIEYMPIAFFYLFRTLAGVTGAMLMILAPPIIMKRHIAEVKSRVSGLIFSGLGLGAIFSGSLVPLLVTFSIEAAWIGMGGIASIAMILSWKIWDHPTGDTDETIAKKFAIYSSNYELRKLTQQQKITLLLILSAYALDAAGYLPHTLFWVDYIARELEYSLFNAGLFWSVFGIGAIIGPVIAGYLGDKIGVKNALIITFALKGTAVALPILSSHYFILFTSSLLIGICTPGTVSLVSTYTLEAVGYKLHIKAWSLMTLFFALSQGIIGYLMAAYSVNAPSYLPLFIISSSVYIISIFCIALTKTKKQLTI